MEYWPYVLLILAGFFLGVPTLVTVLTVRKMSRPEGLLEAVDDPDRLADFPLILAWVEGYDFVPEAQFDFDGLVGAGGARVAVDIWRSPCGRYFLVHYHVREVSYCEFTSSLQGRIGLTTSASKDSLSAPTPTDELMQVFENAPLDRLFDEHLRTLAFFEERFQAHAVPPDRPVRALILDAIRKQMAFVRSLPLWYLRGSWWYWVRRNRLKNRSLVELMKDLPSLR